jgi:hypothetical protein
MKIGCPEILYYDEDKKKFEYTREKIKSEEYQLVKKLRPAIRLLVRAFLKREIDINEANIQFHTCPVKHGYNIEIFE